MRRRAAARAGPDDVGDHAAAQSGEEQVADGRDLGVAVGEDDGRGPPRRSGGVIAEHPASTGYGLGQSVLVAGLVLAQGGLCMILMSPLSARISTAAGPQTTLMVGAVVVAAGYGMGAAFHSSVWELVISSVIVSSGIGLAYGAMPSLIMAAVPLTRPYLLVVRARGASHA